jgi:hypothetical protein
MSQEIHRRLAASLRRARAGRHSASYPLDDGNTVVIRISGEGDRPGLERLAALDSTTLPNADAFLLAELDGELAAAMPLDVRGEFLSDPFRPTANLRELLRLRASRIGSNQGTPTRAHRRTRLTLGTAARGFADRSAATN